MTPAVATAKFLLKKRRHPLQEGQEGWVVVPVEEVLVGQMLQRAGRGAAGENDLPRGILFMG